MKLYSSISIFYYIVVVLANTVLISKVQCSSLYRQASLPYPKRQRGQRQRRRRDLLEAEDRKHSKKPVIGIAIPQPTPAPSPAQTTPPTATPTPANGIGGGSFNSIDPIVPGNEDKDEGEIVPIDPACEAIARNEIYETNNAIEVSYYYELLTKKNVLLHTATSYIDKSVQNLLVDSLIDCSQEGINSTPPQNTQHHNYIVPIRSRPTMIQGISTSDIGKYVGGKCYGIQAYDTSTDICYVVVGSTFVYLSDEGESSSSLTNDEVVKKVYNILQKEFNDGIEDRRWRRRLNEEMKPTSSSSSLLNEEIGLLGLFFLGDYESMISVAEANNGQLNSDTKNIASETKKNVSGRINPGLGASILGVAFFFFAILAFAVVKQMGRKEGEDCKNESYTTKQGGHSSIDENHTISISKTCSLESPTFASDGEIEVNHARDVLPTCRPRSRGGSFDDVNDSNCSFRIERILGSDELLDESATTSQCYTYNTRSLRDGDDDDDSQRSYAYSTAGITLISTCSTDANGRGSLTSRSTAPSLAEYRDRRCLVADRMVSRDSPEAIEYTGPTFFDAEGDTVIL